MWAQEPTHFMVFDCLGDVCRAPALCWVLSPVSVTMLSLPELCLAMAVVQIPGREGEGGETKPSTWKRVQKSFSKVLPVLGSVLCVCGVGNSKNLFKILHPLLGILELTDVCVRLHLQMHPAALRPAC